MYINRQNGGFSRLKTFKSYNIKSNLKCYFGTILLFEYKRIFNLPVLKRLY